mmetsp:Transcript_39210/g.94790  ORF Transcript_39210/g.94790 Transcript_39210/m.94790 type:complete len:108 (+) Transcript_39210:1676-1999(+)
MKQPKSTWQNISALINVFEEEKEKEWFAKWYNDDNGPTSRSSNRRSTFDDEHAKTKRDGNKKRKGCYIVEKNLRHACTKYSLIGLRYTFVAVLYLLSEEEESAEKHH